MGMAAIGGSPGSVGVETRTPFDAGVGARPTYRPGRRGDSEKLPEPGGSHSYLEPWTITPDIDPAMSRNPSVLITGASGEIGHGLIERLAADRDRPIITLDLNP